MNYAMNTNNKYVSPYSVIVVAKIRACPRYLPKYLGEYPAAKFKTRHSLVQNLRSFIILIIKGYPLNE